MDEDLSRRLTALLAKSKGTGDLSVGISGLRGEILKAIGSEETVYGKLTGLLESLRELIPDEKLRYGAALKALSATSKLSTQAIVNAVNKQVEELGKLEKDLRSACPAWRDELKTMEVRLKGKRDEIAKLADKIAALENEEKAIVSGMASIEKNAAQVEEAIGKLFREVGAEVETVRKLVGEAAAERLIRPTAKPAAPAAPVTPAKDKGSAPRKESAPGPSPLRETKWQRACPMCGGQLNFHLAERVWQCYTCAYDEPEKAEIPGPTQATVEPSGSPHPDEAPQQAAEPVVESSLPSTGPAEMPSPEKTQAAKKEPPPPKVQPPPQMKSCPVCRKKMSWYPREGCWRCSYCRYERSI